MMSNTQVVIDEDIRVIVEETCNFVIKDYGIGSYEHGDGKYIDKNLQLSLTTQDIVVQYPIETESVIFTMITGTYCEQYSDIEDYECDYIAELSHIEYNIVTRMFDATYEVSEG